MTAGRARGRGTSEGGTRVDGRADRLAGPAGRRARRLTTHDDEHDPEGVTIGFERAQLQGLLAGARRDLDALDRASRRLAEGTYGRCVFCGEAIPDARLEALPAVETCLACSGRRVDPRRVSPA
ncbi:MAG: TraR/DksA C4-type zinc finger protein [Pseudonocardia sp.]|nr:TraR/DksA C4-type zinc finger protein [Pseudonocardia sp.]